MVSRAVGMEQGAHCGQPARPLQPEEGCSASERDRSDGLEPDGAVPSQRKAGVIHGPEYYGRPIAVLG